jgi:hypothetical protein
MCLKVVLKGDKIMRKLIESIAIAIIFGILLAGISTAHAQGRGHRGGVYRPNQEYVVYNNQRYKPKNHKWYKHRGRGYYQVRPNVGRRARTPRYVRVWRVNRYVLVRRYY